MSYNFEYLETEGRKILIKFEDDFIPEHFLSWLLLEEYAIINSRHFKKYDKKDISVAIITSNIFVSGADAENIFYEELETLYEYMKKDLNYGIDVWISHININVYQRFID